MPGYTKRLILAELKRGAEFDELKFPIKSMQHYKVIQFRSADSKEIAGLGASTNLKDAYKIAYFEYLERKALFDFGIQSGFNSTNGIALHKFKFLASSSARSELFERDSFLLHWHSCVPFIPIGIKEIQKQLIPAINELTTLGYETRFGKTFLGEQQTIITTIMDLKTRGFALGLSSGRGNKKDIEKAFLEACINLFFGDCGKSKNELLNQIRMEGISSLAAHRTLWLYLKELPKWFYGNVESPPIYERITFQIHEILLTKKPFPVVGVYSQGLMKLEIGEASGTTIDVLRRRLKADTSHEIEIWSWPHPIP
ncbi:MAG: hypothetical protein ACXVCP_17115 [Bdellovibrio sp.]